MTEPNPDFDTLHPSGHLLFRTCRGGYLHSVTLSDAALAADAQVLAEAIIRTADVSYLKAMVAVRAEILAAGHTPTGDVPDESDLEAATATLLEHRLEPRRPD